MSENRLLYLEYLMREEMLPPTRKVLTEKTKIEKQPETEFESWTIKMKNNLTERNLELEIVKNHKIKS